MIGKKKYKVSLKGRSGVIYEEEGRKALIEGEMLTGKINLILYFSRFQRWQDPYSDLGVTMDDKERIKSNINSYLKSKGLVIEWD